MKSNIHTKLNRMSVAELKEIVDNSFLYDTEIVEKAKELLETKDIPIAPVVEYIQKTVPSRKKALSL